MSKYNVGDIVTIRKYLIINENYGDLTFVDNMINYLGKKVEISYVDDDETYKLKDIDYYWWSDEMFEDTVIIKTDKIEWINNSGVQLNTEWFKEKITSYLKDNADKLAEDIVNALGKDF